MDIYDNFHNVGSGKGKQKFAFFCLLLVFGAFFYTVWESDDRGEMITFMLIPGSQLSVNTLELTSIPGQSDQESVIFNCYLEAGQHSVSITVPDGAKKTYQIEVEKDARQLPYVFAGGKLLKGGADAVPEI